MHRSSRLARPSLTRFGLATFVAISVTIAAAALTLTSAVAASPVLHRAAVIVETGTETRRVVVEFTEDSITGIEALRRAGAEPVVYSFSGVGGAVCRLFGVGRDSGADCLGGTGGDARYWAYFRAASGASSFQYSRVGAGSTTIRDGDVEGWRFGTGAAPAYVSLATLLGNEPIATTSTTSILAPPANGTTGAQGSPTGLRSPVVTPVAGASGPTPIDSGEVINGGPTGASNGSQGLDPKNRASSGVPAAAILKAPPKDSGRGPESLLLLVLGLAGLGGSAIWARKARARAASR